MSNIAQMFKRGWDDKTNGETCCGFGSRRDHTGLIRQVIQEVTERFQITSINDAGCGDLNWIMQDVLPDYVGYDCVPRPAWAANDVLCYEADITEHVMRPADLIVCRHVLQHLNDARILNAINAFRQSGKYLLCTTSPGLPYQSRTSPPPSTLFRDMADPRWGLGEPICIWEDRGPMTGADEGFVGLWQLNEYKPPPQPLIAIPKVVHQIWPVDNIEPPYKLIDSWRRKNPDWEFNLWQEENIPYGYLRQGALYEDMLNKYRRWNDSDDRGRLIAMMADLLRYEIVYMYGGFYLDADSWCVGQLTPVLDLAENGLLLFHEHNELRHGMVDAAFFAASPKHPFMKTLVDTLEYGWPPWMATGPGHVTRQWFANMYKPWNVTALRSSRYFAPYHAMQCDIMERIKWQLMEFGEVEKFGELDVAVGIHLGAHRNPFEFWANIGNKGMPFPTDERLAELHKQYHAHQVRTKPIFDVFMEEVSFESPVADHLAFREHMAKHGSQVFMSPRDATEAELDEMREQHYYNMEMYKKRMGEWQQRQAAKHARRQAQARKRLARAENGGTGDNIVGSVVRRQGKTVFTGRKARYGQEGNKGGKANS